MIDSRVKYMLSSARMEGYWTGVTSGVVGIGLLVAGLNTLWPRPIMHDSYLHKSKSDNTITLNVKNTGKQYEFYKLNDTTYVPPNKLSQNR